HAHPRAHARGLFPGVPAQQLGRPRDLRRNCAFLPPASHPLTPENPLAEYEFGSGALRGSRLTLYASRLVHVGGESMETVPLAQLAAVGVAFERDPRKLNWAVGLLVAALLLALASGPLQGMIGSLAAGVKEHAGRESLDSVLLTTFSVLGGLARMFMPLAAALAAVAVA